MSLSPLFSPPRRLLSPFPGSPSPLPPPLLPLPLPEVVEEELLLLLLLLRPPCRVRGGWVLLVVPSPPSPWSPLPRWFSPWPLAPPLPLPLLPPPPPPPEGAAPLPLLLLPPSPPPLLPLLLCVAK